MKPWQTPAVHSVTDIDCKPNHITITDCNIYTRGDCILSAEGTDTHNIVGIKLQNYVLIPVEQLAVEVGDALFEQAKATGTLPNVLYWIEGKSNG